LEFRAGKGYFASEPIKGPASNLDAILADAVRRAAELGYNTEDIVRALTGKGGRRPRSILLIESDQGLRDIILYELRPRLNASIRGMSFEDFSERPVVGDMQLVAMSDEKPKIDPLLSDEHTCLYLKGRSVAEAMKGNSRPGEHDIIAVVSGWNDFLTFARVILLAAKIEPGNLIVRSTNDDNWQEALSKASLVVCDALAAGQLDGKVETRVFNIVSDDSIIELAAAVDPSS
ncbi:MAG TPA: hypothetical protein VJL58_03130, partial [Pyrinomonadaceae bacterium]|nr:hypothetical protein [Pyrinomonadaceae bacterium]